MVSRCYIHELNRQLSRIYLCQKYGMRLVHSSVTRLQGFTLQSSWLKFPVLICVIQICINAFPAFIVKAARRGGCVGSENRRLKRSNENERFSERRSVNPFHSARQGPIHQRDGKGQGGQGRSQARSQDARVIWWVHLDRRRAGELQRYGLNFLPWHGVTVPGPT